MANNFKPWTPDPRISRFKKPIPAGYTPLPVKPVEYMPGTVRAPVVPSAAAYAPPTAPPPTAPPPTAPSPVAPSPKAPVSIAAAYEKPAWEPPEEEIKTEMAKGLTREAAIGNIMMRRTQEAKGLEAAYVPPKPPEEVEVEKPPEQEAVEVVEEAGAPPAIRDEIYQKVLDALTGKGYEAPIDVGAERTRLVGEAGLDKDAAMIDTLEAEISDVEAAIRNSEADLRAKYAGKDISESEIEKDIAMQTKPLQARKRDLVADFDILANQYNRAMERIDMKIRDLQATEEAKKEARRTRVDYILKAYGLVTEEEEREEERSRWIFEQAGEIQKGETVTLPDGTEIVGRATPEPEMVEYTEKSPDGHSYKVKAKIREDGTTEEVYRVDLGLTYKGAAPGVTVPGAPGVTQPSELELNRLLTNYPTEFKSYVKSIARTATFKLDRANIGSLYSQWQERKPGEEEFLTEDYIADLFSATPLADKLEAMGKDRDDYRKWYKGSKSEEKAINEDYDAYIRNQLKTVWWPQIEQYRAQGKSDAEILKMMQ